MGGLTAFRERGALAKIGADVKVKFVFTLIYMPDDARALLPIWIINVFSPPPPKKKSSLFRHKKLMVFFSMCNNFQNFLVQFLKKSHHFSTRTNFHL